MTVRCLFARIKGDSYGDYVDYETSLFDSDTGRIRWTIDAKVERGLLEANQLYVIMNGYPAALDYRTGKTRWKALESIGASQYSTNQGSYLIIGQHLLLPRNEDLLVMNKEDGMLLGRIQDVVMGTPEHRDRDAKNGMMNQIDDEVYIGSANGRFRVLPAHLLERDISFKSLSEPPCCFIINEQDCSRSGYRLCGLSSCVLENY